ncbi:hypothetical protein JK358_00470 [Nocardia sp. 2]|uniref:Uncharacterized protein n=1 Tax=Nocardia acididurans TaxID=2802282 RepID=A0ABS1LX31_9NOCA|nr:hypothetical protein [Nocardia acididurans]MBL1072862.1 hypothetical protein [Nocardia acididurans]
MNWAARIEAITEEHSSAVQRLENRIIEIDERARAAMDEPGESAGTDAFEGTRQDPEEQRAQAERERLLLQDAAARAASLRAGNRDTYVLPTDWTEADEARWLE